jgi:hypothetical protein
VADRFRIDATTQFRGHYKAPLEHDTLGQWDLVNMQTGAAIEPVLVIESLELYVPIVRRTKKMADGREVLERLNKYLVTFRGQKKRWIMGPANHQILAGLYGTNPQGWIGKSVKLWVDPSVAIGKTKVGGIRIRDDRPREDPTKEALDNVVDERARETIDKAIGERA